MEKYFTPFTSSSGDQRLTMSDHQGKDHKHRKTANSKPQQTKHHHHHQNRPKSHQSEDNDGYDTHSTVEDNIFSDHASDHPHHRDEAKTLLPHHHHQKKNHQHVSLSETPHSSLTGSSSSSSSSSSSPSTPSSSSPTSSSSSSSSSSSASSTTSSSSPSSSFSTSSSSLSSETSSKYSDRRPLKKPQHSQSCIDISRKHKYFEEEDNDTAPLIEKRCHNRRSAKQERSSHNSPARGPLKNAPRTKRGLGNGGSSRKAKSMEALTEPKDGDWRGNEDEVELERRKGEAKKNLMKEKKKFSAFLNEITRQVLSPMRLTTLGVTNAQRPCSPGRVSVRSGKGEGSTGKQRQRSRHGSADSVGSSCLSPSRSLHPRQRSTDSERRLDRSSLRRRDSWSHSSQHRSHSASGEDHHHQGDHHISSHHHHHGDCNSPCNHHHHGHHHSPVHHHKDHHYGDHHHCDHHHKNNDGTSHHQHSGNHQHGDHHSGDHHHGNHGDHYHGDRHHGDHHSGDHHYGDHHHGDHCRPNHQHGEHKHHGNHHRPFLHHHHGDHQGNAKNHQHGNQITTDHHKGHHTPTHHHGDHHSSGHLHHHGDKHSEAHLHHHGNKHIPDHKHHHGDHHNPDHKHHHGDHHSSDYQHHHGDHPNPDHKHHHGDHHSPDHQHHHGDHHNPDHKHHHGDHHSPDQQHHHGDHHNPDHKHHHGDHHSPGHQHHHGDHHSSGHLHHHGDHQHHRGNRHSEAHQHHHGDHHRPDHQHHHGDHQHHHGDYHSKGHHQGHSNQPPSKNTDLDPDPHLKGRSSGAPMAHRQLGSLPSKKESPSNTSSTSNPSSHDEEQTSFTSSSLHKEKAHELGTIMGLQGQNEGLHHSLLKTAVRMESLGEEFISSQKLLEAELQRTRTELSSLTEKFRRLHDNCSSTQQTNNLLEQKLHSVAQSMEGERVRLNQRISALTEQIADAKFANNVETFSVTSVLNKTDLHFQSDDTINQMVLPITPPPAQFMDSHNSYEKATTGGQDQSLGPVPEEEESDWSEKGDETPRFILTGSNRGQVWRHREADVDKDSESGDEDIVRQHFCPVQIPHLQFTIQNENLSAGMTGEGTYRITPSPNLGSAILIRSASLEEIPLARHLMQKELRGTEAMMDLHHQGHDAIEDLDNEIIHHWRSSSDRPIESRTSDTNSGLASLESAERMLSQFICGSQPGEGRGRAGVHGRTGGIPDELLKGERTQL